ncbi:hypothetical protein A0J61_07867 [Choanephora cucurbitarum]|uniref:Uncharacterized protein n=1 Tax=Choanephora cucurbitarum TaxID=101091 RepID=A0A1C7N9R8_9FUNG|nr:hypothetical protein A0J61_07867 [Choanephora cucurbitarum]
MLPGNNMIGNRSLKEQKLILESILCMTFFCVSAIKMDRIDLSSKDSNPTAWIDHKISADIYHTYINLIGSYKTIRL